ncbi:hypothetical protein Xph01_56150 [Micromonospora phaseoli]|nr:hypothetical protein Xph01_56150 [Micromonospora phaseoli]
MVVVGHVEVPVTSRRRGRLGHAALRLGFLTVVAGVSWCAYDMATTIPAYAAEQPPATGEQPARSPGRAATPATDLIRAILAPVLAPDRPQGEPSRPAAPVEQAPPVDDTQGERVAPPASPPAPVEPGPPSTEAPAPVPVPPSERTPTHAAPAPAGRSPVGPEPTAPPVARGPSADEPTPQRRSESRSPVDEEQVRDAVARLVAPVAATLGPLAEPLIAALSQLLDPASPLLDSIVADLDPILQELTPVLGPLDPILDLLDPVVTLPQPAPIPPDPDPVPQPTPVPTSPPVTVPPADVVSPVDGVPPAEPDRTGVVRPVRADVGTAPFGSAPSAAAGPRVGADTADSTTNSADGQTERAPGQPPVSPAPGTGGVDSSPTSHSGTADAVVAGWAPPPASGRVTRPARTRHRPSRCPRPRSRPA